MADNSSFIQRYELKYLIDEPTAARIRKLVLTFCKPDRHNPPEPGFGYLIKTLYLDTPSLALHRAKLDNHPDRFKLRIRTYDDQGSSRFEIKRKVIDVIRKHRVVVPRDQVADAVAGFVPSGVSYRPTDLDNLQQFARLTCRTGAEPFILVRYEREAYVSEIDHYGRVTFDRRLCFQGVNGLELVGDPREWIPLDGYWLHDGLNGPVILELKCEVRVPIWLSDIIRGFKLSQQGVSKYSHGVNAHLRMLDGKDISRRMAGMGYV